MNVTILGADLRIHHSGIFGPYAGVTWLPRARKFMVSEGQAADLQATKPPYVSASERCP
ncbi:hypothetical protein [Pseudonocardia acaciae]|uniref:hypothetical protein n=1 Tax=Pseudonocardia acaciae TaxID=551276 RepID=UPI000AF27F11|nr:hypothetical protein [Pseudonocardia acaciae]